MILSTQIPGIATFLNVWEVVMTLLVYSESLVGKSGLLYCSLIASAESKIWVDTKIRLSAISLWNWADTTPVFSSRFHTSRWVGEKFCYAYASHLIKKIPMSLLSMAISVKGFPPPLIQVGTNEIFLSDFVRLYQALDGADIPVRLDVYEGMPRSSDWGVLSWLRDLPYKS